MSRTKGINYPFISLKKAIERLEHIYESEHRNPVNVTVAVKHWGYGEKSSRGVRTIAALLSFGLINVKGEKDTRTIQISELGLNIIVHGDDTTSHDKSIKIAALKPKIFKGMWEKYDGALPSDQNMIYFLEREKGVNKTTASAIVKNFRETISISKITKSDSISEPAGKSEKDGIEELGEVVSSSNSQTSKAGMHLYSFPLLDEGQARVEIPKGLSKAGMQKFKAFVGFIIHELGEQEVIPQLPPGDDLS